MGRGRDLVHVEVETGLLLGWLFGRKPPGPWANARCLEGLASKDLERLAPHVTERHLAAGERLVEEGDVASELFLVAEGRLEVVRDGEDGAIALGRVEAGGIVGEVALFDGGDAPRPRGPRRRASSTASRLRASTASAPDSPPRAGCS